MLSKPKNGWSPYEDTEDEWKKRSAVLKKLISETETALKKRAIGCYKRIFEGVMNDSTK